MNGEGEVRVRVDVGDPLVRGLVVESLVREGFVVLPGTPVDDACPDLVVVDEDPDSIRLPISPTETPRPRWLWLRPVARLALDQTADPLVDVLTTPFTRHGLIARLRAARRLVLTDRRHFADLRRDVLTGLPNRRACDEALAAEWSRAERYDRPLCCAMLDVDHFKRVNDRLGHPAGDAVLASIGAALVEGCRRSDFVGRHGGDEFLLLLPETTADGAIECLERILSDITARFDGTPATTLSAGLATRDCGAVSAADLLEAADRSLREAKGAGRGRVGSIEDVAGR